MTPLLRSPPWPGVDAGVAAVSAAGPMPETVDRARLAALVAAVRDARVGGSFWRDDPAADANEAALLGAVGAGNADAPGLGQALLAVRYRDPFTGAAIEPETAVALLAEWRALIEANRGIAAAAGMAWWKRREIARFLWSGATPRFVRTTAQARAAAGPDGAIAVWPSRMPAGLAESGLRLVRVEDGFIRSVGLGSDLHPPRSVVVDTSGIHYDPSHASDLELILERAPIDMGLLARADALRDLIVARGISKYAAAAPAAPPRRDVRRTVLVPGQVEDDMSVRLGGAGIASNLDLLARARLAEPDARILFKPHPDVDAGHRPGQVPDAALLAHADAIVRGEPMPALLARVDAVHVLTSLTGFEALLRGLEVTCHGQPFFAGWGLTTDRAPAIPRRTRRLTLQQLIAGVLILYPRYMDPITGLPCSAEVLIGRMAGQEAGRTTWLNRARQVQGRLVRAYRSRRQGT